MDFFLADDLSGALDAAAAFHRAGRRVTVALSCDARPPPDTDVVGFTTETRNASPADAAQAVARAIAHGRREGGRLLYKKIDSTLRGPVAAEIAALAAALPDTAILFTPANPRVGRTIRDGCLFVAGKPVLETEYARDPVSPVTTGNLRALLAGVDATRITFADATTEADLAAAVTRMAATGRQWVAVGSGALAVPVARLHARAGGNREPPGIERRPGPILMICGSAHALNRRQAGRMAATRNVPMFQLQDDAGALRPARVIAALRTAPGATLQAPAATGHSATVLKRVVDLAQEIIVGAGVRRLFITGGETAFALCRALGIATLSFLDEIEPGLSLACAETSAGPWSLAVKPGGFGDDDTWVRAWDALQRHG